MLATASATQTSKFFRCLLYLEKFSTFQNFPFSTFFCRQHRKSFRLIFHPRRLSFLLICQRLSPFCSRNGGTRSLIIFRSAAQYPMVPDRHRQSFSSEDLVPFASGTAAHKQLSASDGRRFPDLEKFSKNFPSSLPFCRLIGSLNFFFVGKLFPPTTATTTHHLLHLADVHH